MRSLDQLIYYRKKSVAYFTCSALPRAMLHLVAGSLLLDDDASGDNDDGNDQEGDTHCDSD